MPIKVYELAKELKKTNTEMVSLMGKLGLKGYSPASDLDDTTAEQVRQSVLSNGSGASNGTNGTGSAAASAAAAAVPAADASGGSNSVEVQPNITVKELGERFGVSASEVQKVLMGMGVLAALNQRLAADAIHRIAQKMGRTVRIASAGAAAEAPATDTTTSSASPTAAPSSPSATKPSGSTPSIRSAKAGTGPKSVAVKGRAAQGMVSRPPVVTIMGHVDHGKTTLLDTIRKTNVATGEAGGITQHIGAYQVEHNGQRITFLDTPGHAAFTSMRQRGALITDIIVIVVAADDSIMPQTEEAIQIAREANLPLIVAVNKIDVPGANPDRVLTDLTRYELVPEAYGGDVLTANISAKSGEGIPELLDSILLLSEIVVDPKADPHGKAQGTIIEAKLEKGRGAVATVLVQQGTLTMGDIVVAGSLFGKIKGMTDERGSRLTKAGPSTPVEIIGLSSVPEPGDRIEVAKDEREARALAQVRELELRDQKMGDRNLVTLEALYKQLRTGPIKELNLVIKGDVQGSVQAVRDSVADLGNEEVRVRVLTTAVGAISENDILLAASDKDHEVQNALVIGFNVPASAGVEKKAEQEHVRIQTFSIIYELIDAVKDALVAMLDPIYEEAVLGKAEVRALFKLPGGRTIAGAYVTDGIMRRNAKVRVFRGKDLLHTGDIDTLKRFKDDAREVATGYECGLTVRDFNDIRESDVLECFELRQVPREL